MIGWFWFRIKILRQKLLRKRPIAFQRQNLADLCNLIVVNWLKLKKVISVFIKFCLPLRIYPFCNGAFFGFFVFSFVFLWFCLGSASFRARCDFRVVGVFVFFKYILTILPCSRLVKWSVLKSFFSLLFLCLCDFCVGRFFLQVSCFLVFFYVLCAFLCF